MFLVFAFFGIHVGRILMITLKEILKFPPACFVCFARARFVGDVCARSVCPLCVPALCSRFVCPLCVLGVPGVLVLYARSVCLLCVPAVCANFVCPLCGPALWALCVPVVRARFACPHCVPALRAWSARLA